MPSQDQSSTIRHVIFHLSDITAIDLPFSICRRLEGKILALYFLVYLFRTFEEARGSLTFVQLKEHDQFRRLTSNVLKADITS